MSKTVSKRSSGRGKVTTGGFVVPSKPVNAGSFLDERNRNESMEVLFTDNNLAIITSTYEKSCGEVTLERTETSRMIVDDSPEGGKLVGNVRKHHTARLGIISIALLFETILFVNGKNFPTPLNFFGLLIFAIGIPFLTLLLCDKNNSRLNFNEFQSHRLDKSKFNDISSNWWAELLAKHPKSSVLTRLIRDKHLTVAGNEIAEPEFDRWFEILTKIYSIDRLFNPEYVPMLSVDAQSVLDEMELAENVKNLANQLYRDALLAEEKKVLEHRKQVMESQLEEDSARSREIAVESIKAKAM